MLGLHGTGTSSDHESLFQRAETEPGPSHVGKRDLGISGAERNPAPIGDFIASDQFFSFSS